MRWRKAGMRGEGGLVDDDTAEMEMEADTDAEVEGVAPEREGEVDGPARGTGRGRGGASMMARRPSVGVRNKAGCERSRRGPSVKRRKESCWRRVYKVLCTGRLEINMPRFG
jgi:hypothetical protein